MLCPRSTQSTSPGWDVPRTVVTPAHFQLHASGMLRPLSVFCQADHASLPSPSQTSASVSVEAQFGGSKSCQIHATIVYSSRIASSKKWIYQIKGPGLPPLSPSLLPAQLGSRQSSVPRTRGLSTLVFLVVKTDITEHLLFVRRSAREAVSVAATKESCPNMLTTPTYTRCHCQNR